jgi:hypothetical protein
MLGPGYVLILMTKLAFINARTEQKNHHVSGEHILHLIGSKSSCILKRSV